MRLQNRAMAALSRWMMLPSSASFAPSVMPRRALRSARAMRLVVLGGTVMVTDILLLHVSRETIYLLNLSVLLSL